MARLPHEAPLRVRLNARDATPVRGALSGAAMLAGDVWLPRRAAWLAAAAASRTPADLGGALGDVFAIVADCNRNALTRSEFLAYSRANEPLAQLPAPGDTVAVLRKGLSNTWKARKRLRGALAALAPPSSVPALRAA